MGTDRQTWGLRRSAGRLSPWLDRPVSPTPLAFFRVGFGLLMLGAAVRFLAKGWVETQYIQPEFHFTYYLFQWVPALPGQWMYLVFGDSNRVRGYDRTWMALSRRDYRVLPLSFSYVELIDQSTYLNHYYFVSLVAFLLILLPLHHWHSVDARRAGRTGAGQAPRWIPLVLQAQIGIVYFFAGLAKLNLDWLLQAQPLSIWLAARSGFPVLGPLFDQSWFAYMMSWAGAAFDLTIPFLLFWRRTRPWAYLCVIGFHLMTAALFPIGVFPWVMIVTTLIFFDAADYEWVGERLKRLIPVRPQVRSEPGLAPGRVGRVTSGQLGTPSPLGGLLHNPAVDAPPSFSLSGSCALDRGRIPILLARDAGREDGHSILRRDRSCDWTVVGSLPYRLSDGPAAAAARFPARHDPRFRALSSGHVAIRGHPEPGDPSSGLRQPEWSAGETLGGSRG